MTNTVTPRGISTVRFSALDLVAAGAWYTDVLGVAPYFERPGYLEFRVGDYGHELGIMDARYLGELGDGVTAAQPSGAVVYWHVDDLEATLARLVQLGAVRHEPVREFGEGFVAAAVADPFGNIFGVMFNQHYLDVVSGSADIRR